MLLGHHETTCALSAKQGWEASIDASFACLVEVVANRVPDCKRAPAVKEDEVGGAVSVGPSNICGAQRGALHSQAARGAEQDVR
jgi:hypothetical protein